MSARSLGVLARCASALMALAGIGSCTDDGVSLHVICPIPPEVDDAVCSFDAEGDVCTLTGVLNLDVATVYKQSLRVESGLKAREREVPPLGETNGIQARSATIDIRDAPGNRIRFPGNVPNPFRVVASGYIPPGSLGVVAVDMLTPQHVEFLRSQRVGQIVIHVEIEGKTSGNQIVKTSEYLWPVQLYVNTGGVCSEIEHCNYLRGQDFYAFACQQRPD